jgi:chemotaxis protein methyltransferase CheR
MVVASDTADGADRRPLLLEQLSEFVETRMGLYFPAARYNDLERGMYAAAGEFGFDTVDSCIEWLLSSPLSHSQIETLAGHLTVGETYFFRDKNLFEILETRILPEIVNSRRGREQNLRIWSAGCSTGEEPYSLAILLTRLLPDLKEWNIAILATDIAPLSLKKATEGVYSEWSFRNTPRWIEPGCFTEKQHKFTLASDLKRMVTFFPLNLAEDPYPAIINNTNGMDIILCRNVLMYFSRDRANAVIANLARCLVDGGWLVTSPIESPGSDLPPLLQPVHFPGAILFRKAPKPGVEIIRQIAPPEALEARYKPAPAPRTPPLKRASRPNRLPTVSEPEPISDDIARPAAQARLLADQGRLAEALALCAAAIQADKLSPVSYYLQATILQEMGRAKDAAVALNRAIYIDQDFAIAHFSLGHLLQHEGKSKEAGKHLHKARLLLQAYAREEVLPEAEGLSAGRLIELIDTMQTIGNRR